MESKTEFQRALQAFEERVGAELTRQFAIDDTAVVCDLVELLADLDNAHVMLRKATRMKSVKREYLAHLRHEVAACRAELAAELDMWCDIHAVSATSLLAYVRKVKREIEHFVCESHANITAEDSKTLRNRPFLCTETFAATVGYLIRYDPAVPIALRVRVWDEDAWFCSIPNTTFARKKARRSRS